MKRIISNKKGRFAPFWVFLAILGILLIGSFITPFKIVLDDTTDRLDSNAINNGNTLSCSNPDSPWFIKSTCVTLQGFMVIFVLYLLYKWINGMYTGAKSKEAVFSPRYEQMKESLNS